MSPLCHLLHVLVERLLGVDVHLRIVTPLVGIAHLHIEGIQFLVGSLLGRFAHPFLCVDAFSKRNLEVLDQLLHTCLVGGWEVFLHIDLSHSLAQHAVHDAHTALPTRTWFLGTCQDATIEVEHLLIHFIAQHGTSRIQYLPLQPVFQHLHRCVFPHLQRLLDGFGLTHGERINLCESLHIEVSLPIIACILLREVCKRHLMVVGGNITQCHIVTPSLCHPDFQRHHVLSLLLGISRCLAHKLEHLHDMFPVGIQDFLVLLILLHVVVTFQRVAALSDFQQVLRGFHHVGTHIAAPQLSEANTFHVHLVDQLLQFSFGLHSRHTFQIHHHGLHAILVLTHGIHSQGIDVANLLSQRTLLLRLSRQSFDNLTDAFLVLFCHHVKTAIP